MELDVLDFMPDAVVVVDHAGTIHFVNGAAEALFGYERSELLGLPVEVLVPADFRERHRRERERYALTPRIRPMGVGLEVRGRATPTTSCASSMTSST